MFDTMTFTKILGGFCGTFLLFLLVNWGAESLYHVGPAGHGAHDGEELAQAYVIDTGDTGGGEAEEEAVPFAEVMAAADPDAGERVFRKCSACHKLDGTNGTGPHLDGVVGRDIAAVDGYDFSAALADLPGEWTPEELSAFLENPKGYAPGTKMTFNGLPKVQDRADVVAYLQNVGG